MNRPQLLLFGVFLLGPVLMGPALSSARPVSPWSGDPEGFRRQVLQHRRDEAAGKSRLSRGLIAADAAKTFNQTQFDVHHYGLVLDLDFSNQTLTGTVTTTAEVTGPAIATVDLDLNSNMNVVAATAGGYPVGFSHSGDLVTIALDRTYTAGETVVVSLSYQGNPAGSAFGWGLGDSLPMIWTASEPFGARDWWPCKDINTDKADSVDITVTVPRDLIVASNGLLRSDTTRGPSRIFHWRTNYPIATYLVSLAIHPYVQYSHWYTPLEGGPDMEVQYFIYASQVGWVEPVYSLTVPMIATFAQAFGEYPFVNEKYGQATFDWWGAMEHQTITSLGGCSEDMISHELSHQWWGDMVTCADFGHIWLNEGLATWSEAYWAEQTDGVEAYRQYMDIAAYYGDGTVFVEDPLNEVIFDLDLSYNKGSWVVHMLRGVLGDADFFAGLGQYRAAHEYGTATTEDLKTAMEGASGLDLEAFFQQWVYGPGYPVYMHDWVPGPGPSEITVTIRQTQTNAPAFTMPVPLRIMTDQGTVEVTVQNSQELESYVIPVGGTVSAVQLDPDRWILHLVRPEVTDPTFDQGLLLVNGLDWSFYNTAVTSAYADSAFWGGGPVTFWDCFDEPATGYPSILPEPAGHGPVTAPVMGAHSTVIWVSNNYNGDLAKWIESPIGSYLATGGNLLLLTRNAREFLMDEWTRYLGVTWAETMATLGNCTAVAPGLVDIPFLDLQYWNDVFTTEVGPETTLLFTDTAGFPEVRGIGAVVVPAAGGTVRRDGGRLALISGQPFRLDHDALRANLETILADWMLEPYDSLAAAGPRGGLPRSLALGRNHPNPFNPTTVIPVTTATDARLRLEIFDARGRRVRTLADRVFPAGEHAVRWDGRDQAGRTAPSGVYFARVQGGGREAVSRGMVMVR